jgi:RNA recognition motif-containing protein
MATNIYVGNLPWSTTEEELESTFTQYGDVTSAKIITDRDTGRSRGFGFVEMSSGGEDAIQNLNGTMMEGRTIKVNEAQPRKERSPRW